MPNAYAGKLGFVDLTTGEIRIEKLDDTQAREFIGGQGLGVRTLYERQVQKAPCNAFDVAGIFID